MSRKHHRSVGSLAPTATEKAEALWRDAESLAARKKYHAAIEAGDAALKSIAGTQFERAGDWQQQIDEWEAKLGDKDATERVVARWFQRVPLWLKVAIPAVGGLAATLTAPATKLYDHYRLRAETNPLVEAGIAALDRGQLTEANKRFSAALAIDKSDERAKLGQEIAAVYGTADEELSSDVFDSRKDALKARAERVPAFRGHVLTVEGNSWFHAGNLDVAAAMYRDAIAARSTIAEAHTNLGSVLATQRKWAPAKVEFTKALALSPASQSTASGLGYVEAALGNYEGAAKQYEQVLAAEADRLQERLELATLFRILGRFEDAWHQQQRALAGFDDWIKREKNAEPWALLVYRQPREEPWVTQSVADKKYYLNRNLAVTECLLGQTTLAEQHKAAKADARSNPQLPEAVETLLVLELKAIVERHPEELDKVQHCIDWLQKPSDGP